MTYIETPRKIKSDTRFYKNLLENRTCKVENIDDVELLMCSIKKWTIENSVLAGFRLANTCISGCFFSETHFDGWKSRGMFLEGYLHDISANDCIFVDFSFEKMDFDKNTIITNCTFTNVVFSECWFNHTNFQNCVFDNVEFQNCSFEGTYSLARNFLNTEVCFNNCTLKKTVFEGTRFTAKSSKAGIEPEKASEKISTKFNSCTMGGTVFSGCFTKGLQLDKLTDCVIEFTVKNKRSMPDLPHKGITTTPNYVDSLCDKHKNLELSRTQELPITRISHDPYDQSEWYRSKDLYRTWTKQIKTKTSKKYAYRFVSQGMV